MFEPCSQDEGKRAHFEKRMEPFPRNSEFVGLMGRRGNGEIDIKSNDRTRFTTMVSKTIPEKLNSLSSGSLNPVVGLMVKVAGLRS